MTTMRTLIGIIMTCLLAAPFAPAAEVSVELVNHHPADIHMPVTLRGVTLEDQPAVIDSDGAPVQQAGQDLVLLANVPASQTKKLRIIPGKPADANAALKVQPADNGIALAFNDKDLGRLSWDILVEPAQPDTDAGPPSTRRDFDAAFQPLPLAFKPAVRGPLFDTWTAAADKQGIALELELRAFHAGYLDLIARYSNKSAPTTKVYAAIVCRWEQPKEAVTSRSLCYDNHILPFADGAYSTFRAGSDRSLYIQRGVGWINTTMDGGGAAWLNDFTPSFTVHKPATEKSPTRWLGANTAQLAQEAQAAEGAKLYSITEIARPNVKGYRSRLSDSVLPQHDESPIEFTSRLVFAGQPLTDEQVDQQFVTYVGFRHQEIGEGGATRLSFGVPYVRFGTNYFPYSTLGENFIDQRIGGMSKEGYWPLAAATVNQYKLFAGEIQRDLRILKSMGFELSRLHHLEVLWDKDPNTGQEYVDQAARQEYLDFYFGELKKLGLKALVDVKLTPEQVAWLVERYRPLIDEVEIDNEVLIFQIADEDVQYWKDVYAAVKKVAPEIGVHLTCHTNTGAFNRLIALGVPFDRIGAHAYLDSIEAIPSARDYALAVGNYAAKQNKEAQITEWNWRFLTRMTDDARAKVYPPIFESVLSTRSISTMYQFQFNDSLAMNPAQLKGIRHYELLHLSRRPKPEALELAKLIRKYCNPAGPVAEIDTHLSDGHVVTTFTGAIARGAFSLTNTSGDKKALALKASIECFDGASAELADQADAQITLAPGQTKQVPFTVTAPSDALPGFYHVFLRLEGDGGSIRYAWAEARLQGQPQLDQQTLATGNVVYGDSALDFDFNRPIAIVYGQDAPIPELEAAWVIYQTLESASGRKVDIYQLNDVPEQLRAGGTLICFGTPQSNALIGEASAALPKDAGAYVVRIPAADGHGERLIVGGKDTAGAQQSAMDLTLRYWKKAKDSAARRVGLTSASSGVGGVKTDID